MIRAGQSLIIVSAAGVLAATPSMSDTLTVGPGAEYRLPSDAALMARDGDVVEIAAGEYRGDAAVWEQHGLTLRGLDEGAHLIADGASAESKAIWVIKGDDVRVENVAFSGARVRDRNGAGIRLEGSNLTVSGCRFVDNENGILTGAGTGQILIEYSEFANNGFGDGQSHNLYIGAIDKLVIQGSYFHHANIGHNIKSRAKTTVIQYNRIMDFADGRSSYLVDLPDGGTGILVGNILQQGPATDNSALISYGAETDGVSFGTLVLVNNTLVNDRHAGIFVKVATPYAGVHLQNNLFVGEGDISNRPYRDVANLSDESGMTWFGKARLFVDRERYDYRLIEGADAIDHGQSPMISGIEEGLKPEFEYRDPMQIVARRIIGDLDLGALEYSSH